MTFCWALDFISNRVINEPVWVEGFADKAHIRKEKEKARYMRQSNWWKQRLGRGQCYHCELQFSPQELTMDHLVPIARGGKTTKKNLVVSCKGCNSKKSYYNRSELAMMEFDISKGESPTS